VSKIFTRSLEEKALSGAMKAGVLASVGETGDVMWVVLSGSGHVASAVASRQRPGMRDPRRMRNGNRTIVGDEARLP
jgi:hypothetical protein